MLEKNERFSKYSYFVVELTAEQSFPQLQLSVIIQFIQHSDNFSKSVKLNVRGCFHIWTEQKFIIAGDSIAELNMHAKRVKKEIV